MAIWVHIAPSVSPDGAGAKTALNRNVKTALEKSIVELVTKALPADKFTTRPADKPKGGSKGYNAIKVTAGVKLTVDTQGSKLKVGCNLKMEFEAIKAPSTSAGNLLGAGSKGAAVENRGSGERDVIRFAGDALDAIVGPLVKSILAHPRFTSYGKSMGLPL